MPELRLRVRTFNPRLRFQAIKIAHDVEHVMCGFLISSDRGVNTQRGREIESGMN